MSYTYALDPSGVAPVNLVRNESHVLVSQPVRLFAPNFGAFFTESMKLFDLGDNSRLLTPGVDYYAAELVEIASGLYNKEICKVIVIKNAAVTNEVMMNYQVLGDFYSEPATETVAQIGRITAAGQHDWKWGPLITPIKPSQYPPQHYVDRNDNRVGFEYQEHALDRIRQLLIGGFPEAQEDLYAYIDNTFSLINTGLDQAAQRLADHIANHNNTHVVTPTQLGVYTMAEVNAMHDQVVNTFNVPYGQLEQKLADHVANHANPHHTTGTALQLWTKQQLDDRLAQVVANNPNGDNGYWQVRLNSEANGWSDYNEFNQAVFYTFTVGPSYGHVGNKMYVNGALICDAFNNHTNWQKAIMSYMLVPAKGSITLYTDTGSGAQNAYGLRFVPI